MIHTGSVRLVALILVLLGVFIATAGCGKLVAGVAKDTLPGECVKLRTMARAANDSSPFIAACLSRLTDHATLRLPPGKYHLRTPLAVSRPVTIETAVPNSTNTCRKGDSVRCAVFVMEEMPKQSVSGIMPIEITAPDVTLRAIAVMGSNTRSAEWQKQVCLNNNTRPLGGGMRVRGAGFRLQDSLIRNFSCATALEIMPSAVHPSVLDSTIGPNGAHDADQMWSDGVTIHDTSGARMERNYFIGNTDVQLILGGCRDCVLKDNVFRHPATFAHASFAELMLHAWPNTSGDFTGSTTSHNDIDCGTARRCGYGIMIGGEPWYPAKTFGGAVSDNRIANALVALNVDRLTGPMTLTGNKTTQSGGIAGSDCGQKTWPAVNISPSSVKLARTDMKNFGSVDTAKCILLRQP